MMRPPRSVVPAFASTGTSISRPAANAVRPVPPSRYSGSSTLMLKLPIMAMVVSTSRRPERAAFHGRQVDERILAAQLAQHEQRRRDRRRRKRPTASGTSMVSSTSPRLSAQRNTAESTVDGMSR